MGGVSASQIAMTPEGLVFSGVVSLAHGGGFASIRAQPRAYDLTGAIAFVLRVRGDGRTDKFGLRTDDAFDGVRYQARFATRAGEWLEVVLPVADFQPTFRGRPADAPPLDPARIRGLGLLIADRQAVSVPVGDRVDPGAVLSKAAATRPLQRFASLHIMLRLLGDFRDILDRLQDFHRCVPLIGQVADQEQQGLHSFEVAHGFPAHRLVSMKQRPLPIRETGVADR